MSEHKYRGVTFDSSQKRKNQWKAQVYRKKQSPLFVGRFDSAEAAARAYDVAAKNLYGDNAVLNFPQQRMTPAQTNVLAALLVAVAAIVVV